MRFIQVGVGGFGRAWVNVLKNDRRAKVVGLVDINKQAMEKACADVGYDESICFTSLEQALKSVEADALVCVTPPDRHRQPVVAALRAGLHVISEKPMAESLADCKTMLRAARQANRTYVVSQNYRYSNTMYTIADLVQKGKIGAIGQVKIDFFKGIEFGGFRAAMDYPLLVDMSIHHFDLIRFLTGLDPVSVRGQAWNPPWSHFKGDCSSAIVFEMSQQAKVLYNGSWCAKGDYCDWNGNWQLEGSKGAIVYRRGVITLNQAPDGYHVTKSTEIKPRTMRKTAQAFVLNNFLKCIKSGERPFTDVYDNIKSVAMVFAAVKAVKTERKITVVDPTLKRLIRGK
ncbi:Gfo/Idh/MocA family protein [Candidatus Sumerlaeota bacterium]